MEYCRATTNKELLCKKRVCKNSAFCIHHRPKKENTNKFRYSIPNDQECLPEDILYNIYKLYFKNII